MIIVSNKKLIQRNQRIAKFAINGTLILLIAYTALFVFSWNNPNLAMWSLLAVLPALILSQIAGYYGTRFGRSPRPDEELIQALKGLDDKYVLYNYMTPVSHLLVGPAGIWILMLYFQAGIIRYDENRKRWRQIGGNAFLKIFGQGGIGRPDLDVRLAIEDINKYINKLTNQTDLPPVNAALVFTNKNAIIDANNAPQPTLPISKLKDLIRRKAKESTVPMETVRLLQKALPVEE